VIVMARLLPSARFMLAVQPTAIQAVHNLEFQLSSEIIRNRRITVTAFSSLVLTTYSQRPNDATGPSADSTGIVNGSLGAA